MRFDPEEPLSNDHGQEHLLQDEATDAARPTNSVVGAQHNSDPGFEPARRAYQRFQAPELQRFQGPAASELPQDRNQLVLDDLSSDDDEECSFEATQQATSSISRTTGSGDGAARASLHMIMEDKEVVVRSSPSTSTRSFADLQHSNKMESDPARYSGDPGAPAAAEELLSQRSGDSRDHLAAQRQLSFERAFECLSAEDDDEVHQEEQEDPAPVQRVELSNALRNFGMRNMEEVEHSWDREEEDDVENVVLLEDGDKVGFNANKVEHEQVVVLVEDFSSRQVEEDEDSRAKGTDKDGVNRLQIVNPSESAPAFEHPRGSARAWGALEEDENRADNDDDGDASADRDQRHGAGVVDNAGAGWEVAASSAAAYLTGHTVSDERPSPLPNKFQFDNLHGRHGHQEEDQPDNTFPKNIEQAAHKMGKLFTTTTSSSTSGRRQRDGPDLDFLQRTPRPLVKRALSSDSRPAAASGTHPVDVSEIIELAACLHAPLREKLLSERAASFYRQRRVRSAFSLWLRRHGTSGLRKTVRKLDAFFGASYSRRKKVEKETRRSCFSVWREHCRAWKNTRGTVAGVRILEEVVRREVWRYGLDALLAEKYPRGRGGGGGAAAASGGDFTFCDHEQQAAAVGAGSKQCCDQNQNRPEVDDQGDPQEPGTGFPRTAGPVRGQHGLINLHLLDEQQEDFRRGAGVGVALSQNPSARHHHNVHNVLHLSARSADSVSVVTSRADSGWTGVSGGEWEERFQQLEKELELSKAELTLQQKMYDEAVLEIEQTKALAAAGAVDRGEDHVLKMKGAMIIGEKEAERIRHESVVFLKFQWGRGLRRKPASAKCMSRIFLLLEKSCSGGGSSRTGVTGGARGVFSALARGESPAVFRGSKKKQHLQPLGGGGLMSGEARGRDHITQLSLSWSERTSFLHRKTTKKVSLTRGSAVGLCYAYRDSWNLDLPTSAATPAEQLPQQQSGGAGASTGQHLHAIAPWNQQHSTGSTSSSRPYQEQHRAELAFVLLGRERDLELIAPNLRQFLNWYLGLQYLLFLRLQKDGLSTLTWNFHDAEDISNHLIRNAAKSGLRTRTLLTKRQLLARYVWRKLVRQAGGDRERVLYWWLLAMREAAERRDAC